jgi:hypothetical protein
LSVAKVHHEGHQEGRKDTKGPERVAARSAFPSGLAQECLRRLAPGPLVSFVAFFFFVTLVKNQPAGDQGSGA